METFEQQIETVRQFFLLQFGPRGKSIRGAFLSPNCNNMQQQIVIYGFNEYHVYPYPEFAEEMEFIRKHLGDLGLRETASGCYQQEGYFIVVELMELLKISETEPGVWTFAVAEVIHVSRLLESLTTLVWRGYSTATLPQLQKIAEEDAADDDDDGEEEEDPEPLGTEDTSAPNVTDQGGSQSAPFLDNP